MIKSLSEITQIWDKTLKLINEKLAEKQLFDSFFADSYINDIHGSTVELVVNSAVASNLMKNKYNDIIAESIKEITGERFDFEYIQASEIKPREKANFVESKQEDKGVKLFEDSVVNPRYRFENFIEGDSNREARQAALMAASSPGTMFNPLFIYSHSGLGKTHLLHSIGNYVGDKFEGKKKVLYLDANTFVDEYIKFAKGESAASSLRDYFKTVDVLLFDDVQFLSNKVRSQEMFFTIYNDMYNRGAQIVITSDRQPYEIANLEDRLVTRFSQGLVSKIEEPEQDTCVKILKSNIVNKGFSVDNFDLSVLYFLADKFSTNIRELEGSITRLIFYAEQFKNSPKVTMDIAIEAMQGIVGGKNLANQMTEQKIINVVADYYGLTSSQITGKVRTGQIALARHIAMYLIRYSLDIPLKRIGDMFGGKDHTTVMSGITKVETMLKTDPNLQIVIDELKKRLNQ